MPRRTAFAVLLSALFAVAFEPPRAARAQQDAALRLRIATLAPTNSSLGQAYRTLDHQLRQGTSGRVAVQLYGGGAAGDEAVMVRKMRVGQLDGAALTTTGLGMIVPQVHVLEAPGLIETYRQLDAVRDEMAGDLDRMFEQAGFKLIGWGDAGELRLFSTHRIARPADLRTARPWVWRDSPLMVESIRQTGANGVALGVPEVYPGLQTGRIDTVVASALTAIALQWHTSFRTMTRQSSGVIVGALVFRKDKFDALPEQARTLILQMARDSQGELRNGARRMDTQAFQTLSSRLTLVDTDPYRAEWEDVGRRARESVIGRLYTRELLDRVDAIVRRVGR